VRGVRATLARGIADVGVGLGEEDERVDLPGEFGPRDVLGQLVDQVRLVAHERVGRGVRKVGLVRELRRRPVVGVVVRVVEVGGPVGRADRRRSEVRDEFVDDGLELGLRVGVHAVDRGRGGPVPQLQDALPAVHGTTRAVREPVRDPEEEDLDRRPGELIGRDRPAGDAVVHGAPGVRYAGHARVRLPNPALEETPVGLRHARLARRGEDHAHAAPRIEVAEDVRADEQEIVVGVRDDRHGPGGAGAARDGCGGGRCGGRQAGEGQRCTENGERCP